MPGTFFSFGCGRHHLTGTYVEQQKAYAEISRLREELGALGAFTELDKNEQKLASWDLWFLKMDLVWEEYCRRTNESQKPPE